jgi:cell division septal protein FtsQ
MKKRNVYLRRKKKSILSRRWFWDFVLVLIFLISFSYLLLRTPYFEIENIKVSGGKPEIEKEVKKMIDHKNFFLLNSASLSKHLKEIFPQVREAVARKKFPNSISVQIRERKEFGIFCVQAENSPCFSISDEGVVFKETEKRSDMFLILDLKANQPKLGAQVIEEDLMKNIAFLQEELKKSQISLKEIEILPLEIRAKTEQGFLIYFSKETSVGTQIEILLESLQKTISKEEQEILKYIDLRGLKPDQRGVVYWE